MRDRLRDAVKDPYFRLTLMVGIHGLIDAARHLSSIGIDVNEFITQALKDVSLQLNDAAYAVTDLDALLNEARAIGDEVVKKPQAKEGIITPTSIEEDDDKSQGYII